MTDVTTPTLKPIPLLNGKRKDFVTSRRILLGGIHEFDARFY
jgi:hypothetical protein